MFGARFSKEVLGLGMALGLVFALAEPINRMMSDAPAWRTTPSPERAASRGTVAYNLHRVPYGIDNGLCDRGAVADDAKHGVVIPAEILAGSAVGAQMDPIDHTCVRTALEYAPDLRRVLWRNGNTGLTYTVIPRETFQTDRGVYCREYTISAVVGGRGQDVHEQACRQPAGTWTIVR